MTADFADAAVRHWEDAELLRERGRLPNADQLFGLAAEGALKAIMAGLGMATRPDGAPQERRHLVHIDELWDEFATFASGTTASQYAPSLQVNPFRMWRISQRYCNSKDISLDDVALHRRGAMAAMAALRRAQIDGRVR